MSRAKFSWTIDDNSDCLVLLVDHGDRKVSWKVSVTQPGRLAKVFREVAQELSPIASAPAHTVRHLIAPMSHEQSPEPVEAPQQSEEASMEQLAAKATAVGKTGGNWFANLADQGTELPLYTLGHGGEPE